ncbi:pseudouridine synthase [Alteromonas sp. C1M14]|uniref:pseudouridine synthase n=1 Tax=Alteromonas sp. C1M14 TaxID=2841567 RepID=UPI0020905090|nr:pseudouridine synthase [Alteromonas sp. C1M14]
MALELDSTSGLSGTDKPEHTIHILYQDEHVVAMDKPPGLLVHRSPIDKRETQFAVQQLRDKVGRHVYPVHRLDRPTSGVLLFAFDGQTASALGQAMMNKQIAKRYVALVRGWMFGSGFIDYALSFKRDKYADAHRGENIPPQSAQTEYETLQRFLLPEPVGRYAEARYSLVALQPFTGRKHQLRRHLVHLRHPIIGDTTHGDGKQNKFAREYFDFGHLALTCTHMHFIHPVTNKRISVSTTPHGGFSRMLATLEAYRCDTLTLKN